MKLGKITDGAVELIEVEAGKELSGVRSEEQLYAEGYKKVCLTPKPSEDAIEFWKEYPTCIVQEWEIADESTNEI